MVILLLSSSIAHRDQALLDGLAVTELVVIGE
jgi:hypothetical protein